MQIQSRDSFEAFEYFYVFDLTEDSVTLCSQYYTKDCLFRKVVKKIPWWLFNLSNAKEYVNLTKRRRKNLIHLGLATYTLGTGMYII